jgi:homoserine kinase
MSTLKNTLSLKSMPPLGGGVALVRAPATIANLVCGFDVLGLAVNAPYDEMQIELLDEPKIIIEHIDHFNLPTEASQNVAGVALQALLDAYENKNIGFKVTINKLIKPGSGLGSSAASAAGAVVGANHLLNNYFSKKDLVQFAMHGEKLASGVKHADNITPCIYGGVTLIRSIHPLDIVPLKAPPIYVTIVHPQIEVKTSDARQILRREVQLKDAIKQWGNIAGLVAGFLQNDFDLIGRSLEDVIVEPIRSILIPCFDEVKQKCLAVGALGGGISGSGPSIFMLSKDELTAQNVEKEMIHIYTRIGIDFNTFVTTINNVGVTIIEKM